MFMGKELHYPTPMLYCPPPTYNSHPCYLKLRGGTKRNETNELTDRTHPRFVSFIVLDYVICNCQVYLEHYTSILTVGHQELEKFYEREIILADRWMLSPQELLMLVCQSSMSMSVYAMYCQGWLLYFGQNEGTKFLAINGMNMLNLLPG